MFRCRDDLVALGVGRGPRRGLGAGAARAARAAARQRHRPARAARHRARVRPARHRRGDPGRRARARPAQGHDGRAQPRRKRTFSVPFACQGNGTAYRKRRSGTLARASYRCVAGRATARLTLSKKVAARVVQAARRRGDGDDPPGRAHATRVSFTLTAGQQRREGQGLLDRRAPAVLAGRLRRAAGVPDAARLHHASRRRRSPPAGGSPGTPRAGGWHWLGSGETGAGTPGRPRWAASRSSIPGGAATPIPFTWGPISVPAGQAIYAVGVYEIVYWVGGRPDYQWQYVNAGTTGAAAAGTGNLYCAYA